MISAVFVIGMIYFYTMTGRSQVVQQYRSTLSPDLLKRYDNIAKERMMISYEGYGVGFLFSLLIILSIYIFLKYDLINCGVVSSAVERLPYKQRVTGSNPVLPNLYVFLFFFF